MAGDSAATEHLYQSQKAAMQFPCHPKEVACGDKRNKSKTNTPPDKD
jgi:hypothetical protein